jgi:hypothetical protein
MNTSTNCPQARQRCPSPWACGEGCNFNNEVDTTAHGKASAVFWAPDMPVQFVGPEPDESRGYPFAWLDEILNTWDDLSWWQIALSACGLIVVAWLVAAVVFQK